MAPPEELDAAVAALCDAIRAKPAATVATGKRMFYRQIEKGLTEAHRYAGGVMACDMMGDDAQEGIGAFLEKRPAALGGHPRRRVASRAESRAPPRSRNRRRMTAGHKRTHQGAVAAARGRGSGSVSRNLKIERIFFKIQ